MTIEVRRARGADRAAMAEIWTHAADTRRADVGLPATCDLAAIRLQLADRMSAPSCRALIACEGDHAVGMALGLLARENDGAGPGFVPGLMHISMVAVVPEAWGRRVGSRLLTVLLEEARMAGFSAVQLWTHSSNQRSAGLYERMGFTRSGRTKIDEGGELIAHWERSLRSRSGEG